MRVKPAGNCPRHVASAQLGNVYGAAYIYLVDFSDRFGSRVTSGLDPFAGKAGASCFIDARAQFGYRLTVVEVTMRVVVVAILMAFCLLFGPAIFAQRKRTPQLPCEKTAQTQLELNNCAHLAYVKADAEMNRVYKQLMASSSESGEKYQQKLKEAQVAWLKYRDATCESEAVINEGGSIYPMIYDYCLASVTEERTKRLKNMLAEY